jgi:hypothetical protein
MPLFFFADKNMPLHARESGRCYGYISYVVIAGQFSCKRKRGQLALLKK